MRLGLLLAGALWGTGCQPPPTTNLPLPVGQFALGWYDRLDPSNLPRFSSEGMNLVMPYTGQESPAQLAALRAYLDAAAQLDLAVLVEVWRDRVLAGDVAAVVAEVHALKDHPALFRWYLYDEPDVAARTGEKTAPADLRPFYDAIRAEDPAREVAVVFSRYLADAPPYLSDLDVYLFDYYPELAGSSEFSNLPMFHSLVTTAAAQASGKAGFWPVLQGFGDEPRPAPRRFPTTREATYMLYASLLAGADGALYFYRPWSKPGWVDGTLAPLLRDVRGLVPAVRSGAIDLGLQVAGSSSLEAKLYRDPTSGTDIVIAMNHSTETTTATLTLAPSIPSQSVAVLGETRSIALTRGSFTDSFAPFEVRRYEVR